MSLTTRRVMIMLVLMALSTKRRHRRNYNIPGDAHELTFSCYHNYEFIRAERTCAWLKAAIDEARVELDFALCGFDRNINTVKALRAMIEYIHLNPVRRGLVAKAVAWKWSSAAWYELGRPGPISIDPIPPQWLDMDD